VKTYFILIVIFAVSSEILPRFGTTETYLLSIGYAELHDSGGIFIDLPFVPLSMGVVYFTLLAFYESAISNWFKPKDTHGFLADLDR